MAKEIDTLKAQSPQAGAEIAAPAPANSRFHQCRAGQALSTALRRSAWGKDRRRACAGYHKTEPVIWPPYFPHRRTKRIRLDRS